MRALTILILLLSMTIAVYAPGASSGGGGGGRGGGSSSSGSRGSSSGAKGGSSSSPARPSGFGRGSYAGKTRTVSNARSSLYGPGLARYNGPSGNYAAGTRATYVYPQSHLFFGYAWLLLYADTVTNYNSDEVQIDLNQLPPGCEIMNGTSAPAPAPMSLNDTVSENTDDIAFWQQSQIYNDVSGNASFSCAPVDITIGVDDSTGLSGNDIAWIVIGSIIGSIVILVLSAWLLTCCIK